MRSFSRLVPRSRLVRSTLLLSAVLLAAPLARAGMADQLVAAARSQIGVTIAYDGSYRKLAYPGGDVPLERGVCTDVVIRAYRTLGVDLQQRVHQDMRAAWHAYPKRWGLKAPDPNIDHRRVPNLEVFFARHGNKLAPSARAADFEPGDIVSWELPGGLPHIGIVADARAEDGTPLVVHNIGSGARLENVLFAYRMVGHYRYRPATATAANAAAPRAAR